MRILVTGGCGFVGSSLALAFKRDNPKATVTAFDNLRRRGSELALARLKAAGVAFCHGDIRNPDDLAEAGPFDLLLECSAEPSAQAGYNGSPAYVVQTNLFGTVNCMEAARHNGADVVFLSTSRVYPVAPLRALPLEAQGERLVIPEAESGTGWSAEGISETFPLEGTRTLYGATKLASELIVAEYDEMYGMRTIVNRCGVLTGPWQMGKVDQGFIVLWAARHFFGGQLAYIGHGGHGHQVRDLLHVDDLYALLCTQLADPEAHRRTVYNVGGGAAVSVSLAELTTKCQALAGRSIDIQPRPETHAADIPYYVTDNSRVASATGWQPTRGVDTILADVFAWLREHDVQLRPILT